MLRAYTRQYGVVLKRRDAVLEIMLAQNIAMVANTGFKGWEKAREPKEFMVTREDKPSKGKSPIKRRKRAAIATDAKATMFTAMKMFGG